MENTRKRASEQTSRIDYAVILPVFILCIIGLTSLYVALSQDPAKPNVVRGVGLQTLWYILGIGAIAIIMHIKVKLLWKLTPLIYGGGLLVMALLLQFSQVLPDEYFQSAVQVQMLPDFRDFRGISAQFVGTGQLSAHRQWC